MILLRNLFVAVAMALAAAAGRSAVKGGGYPDFLGLCAGVCLIALLGPRKPVLRCIGLITGGLMGLGLGRASVVGGPAVWLFALGGGLLIAFSIVPEALFQDRPGREQNLGERIARGAEDAFGRPWADPLGGEEPMEPNAAPAPDE